jgi:pimeloyl-ACP methyl ester carboxylesterase
MTPNEVEIRVHGQSGWPTLVYLPGLHGDWTLVGGFRKQVEGKLRFVELTYPRTLDWSLNDYAAGIEQALESRGISEGWLLGESFGSQIVWPLACRRRFTVNGIVLAGGFGRHPAYWGVRLAERTLGAVSLRMITRALFGYARVAKWRFRHQPEVLASLGEFIQRRTELDRQAAVHRLRLIAENDPSPLARGVDVPVYAISGGLDPVVPWFPARRWLCRNCPELREYRIIGTADHTVLSTGSRKAAEIITHWIARGQQRAAA